MRKVVLFAAAVALVLASAALADKPADKGKSNGAAAACKALKKSSPADFGKGKKYRNLGACVSAQAHQKNGGTSGAASSNPAKTCKAEQADSNFAGSHGGKSFADYYGTNANKKNAFGKCVSSHAKKT